MVTLADILKAQHRIKPHLSPTPLEAAGQLGENIWLKLENANKTHSFKIRGALNAILSLDDTGRKQGIITASSGNHAQGLAYAAHLVGAQADILMPEHTPQKKVKGVQLYGGNAILFGDNFDETEAEALRRAREDGQTFISAYNHPSIIAGTGTIGLEVLETLPGLERMIVCVSGGGLISGIALAIKSLKPDCEVIGVCAESAPSMYNEFKKTNLVENWDTLAEALSGGIEAGSITVTITLEHVDDIVLVSEEQIAAAMRFMMGTQGWLVEGGGAVCVAALLHDIIPRDGKVTAATISGGNVDLDTLRKVLDV